MKHIIFFLLAIGLLLIILWRAFPEAELTHGEISGIGQHVLIGTMLSGSVLFYFRHQPGKALHALLIWLTIGFACIVLYTGKNAILAALIPGRTQQGDTITLRAATDGHFYINAEINQKPVRFMIDTGASTLFIPLNTAKRLGISTNNLAFTQQFQTANGQTYGAPVILNSLTIGGHVFAQVSAYISQGESGTPLMGLRFLNRAKSLEIREDELIIHF